MALKLDDISINTLLGNGSFISGDIKVNGFVRVDGDIDGNLETDGNIIIGENAKIRGNIVGKSVIVGGIVLGNIFADESVKLMVNSAVMGDIVSHKVQIEDTAKFHGHLISIKEEEKYQSEKDKYFQSKAIQERVTLS
ncbi:MAG: polymer-forming cytoskeletal protein [Treponema sp.]|nr:polymer-forming cytoskeletal protein [Treponema sp.]MCI5666664.1 polymer-forming cytoskeletal protein [Spirochaetia bacterium]MDY3130127.1 polymer-forming cytoskeletal protein [Treponema sp.]